MNVCQDGLNRMHDFVRQAPGDIRHRLWSFYWLARMTHTPKGCMVELGTRGGDSTRAFLAACVDMGGNLVSYDIEDCSHVIPDSLLPYWLFSRRDSVQAGKEWPQHPIDLVFVDTDHTLETTRREIAVWHKHVRVGGCMVFHDYWLDDPPRDGVKPAVDEFANAHPETWRLETWDKGPEGDTGGCVTWRVK